MSSLTYKGKRHLPLPKGPYTVGCTDVMTGYSEKGCFVRLHYPCSENDVLEHHEQWPRWTPTKEYAEAFISISEFPSLLSRPIVERLFSKFYIPAIWESAPLNKGKLYPVIVFSHGLTACRTTYSANLTELASHGYIVAAVEHRDESACYTYYMKKVKSSDTSEDQYSEATVEKQPIPLLTKSISSEFFSLRNKQVHQRAEECIRALDLLMDINDGNSPKNVLETNFNLNQFRGLFDMSKVALIGHSFGGATTLLALSKEPRFRVGVTFDPWIMPISKEDLPSRLTQPLLLISSQGFYDKENMEILEKFQERKIETKFHTIWKTTHLSQCDVPFIMPDNVLTRIARWGTKGDYKSKYIHLDIHNRMMMSFLSKHLDLPVDDEFQNFLESSSAHIMDGIIFAQPTHRRSIRIAIFIIGICLTILLVAIFCFIFW